MITSTLVHNRHARASFSTRTYPCWVWVGRGRGERKEGYYRSRHLLKTKPAKRLCMFFPIRISPHLLRESISRLFHKKQKHLDLF